MVRETCDKVAAISKQVSLNQAKIEEFCKELASKPKTAEYTSWRDCTFHFFDAARQDAVVDYVFIMDSLNFCFWQSDWEYEHLATNLKNTLMKDYEVLKPKNLVKMTFEFFQQSIFPGKPDFPLIKERYRIVREMGAMCLKYYDGEFVNVVKAAKESAQELVEILTRTFPNFRDHAIYEGNQIFLYKRVQILVGDLWGAFEGKDYGKFNDIDKLTMFPDYRVPQILVEVGIFEYSEDAKEIIKNKKEIPSGSKLEVEIRANTVVAVERIRETLAKEGIKYTAVEVDWLLWQKGEAVKDEIFPHHRVLTIFY